MDAPRTDRLDALDGLRGGLALWVAVTHVLCWCGFAHVAWPAGLDRAWFEFVFARPAVDVFIILSGFAVATLLARGPVPYGDYLRRRAMRIYPTYLVCLALGLLTVGVTPTVLATARWADQPYFTWVGFASASERAAPLTHLAWHFTLLHGLAARDAFPDATATLLTPAWSVSLEWQFYLVAPTVMRLAGRRAGAAALVVISILGGLFCLPWANPQLAFLPAKLGLFLIGIASHRLDKDFPQWRTRTLVVGTVLATAGGYHWMAVAIWAAVLWACRTDAAIGRMVRRTLEHAAARTLGRMSYPLYLVHWPLIIFGLAGLLRLRPDVTPGVALAAMLVVGLPTILVAASALHRWVEAPCMAWRPASRGTTPTVDGDAFTPSGRILVPLPLREGLGEG